MNSWNLRTEILKATHRWYLIVAVFLFGALLGWIISLLIPAPYRAVQDIYVGLNAYRTGRDVNITEGASEQFRNLDDYKNWQMGQLDSLAVSDDYLEKTLTRLRLLNDDWLDISVAELRPMLSISWRNTGDWHFSAQAAEPQQASQVVSIWSQVVVEEVAFSVDAARRMILIDAQLQSVSEALVDREMRLILLEETQSSLDEWQRTLENEISEPSLAPLTYWRLLNQVTNAAGLDPGWESIIKNAPTLTSSPDETIAWLFPIKTLINAELAVLPVQIESLTDQQMGLAAEYFLAADESRALSANLEAAVIKSEAAQVTHLRPEAAVALIGGILALLILAGVWLVQISSRTEQ